MYELQWRFGGAPEVACMMSTYVDGVHVGKPVERESGRARVGRSKFGSLNRKTHRPSLDLAAIVIHRDPPVRRSSLTFHPAVSPRSC